MRMALSKQKIDSLNGLTPDTLMYEYDAARAVTRIIHGRDVRDTTTYRYNTANGGLDTLDFGGAGLNNNYRFRFVYDGLGRCQQVTYPNGTIVTINHDAGSVIGCPSAWPERRPSAGSRTPWAQASSDPLTRGRALGHGLFGPEGALTNLSGGSTRPRNQLAPTVATGTAISDSTGRSML